MSIRRTLTLAIALACLVAPVLPATAGPLTSVTSSSGCLAPVQVQRSEGFKVEARNEVATIADVQAVAKSSGLPSFRAQQILNSDRSVHIGACDKMFYTEASAPVPLRGASLPSSSPSQGQSTSASAEPDVFKLNSRPGATRTLYINFSGYTLTSSMAKAFGAPAQPDILQPYDLDGDPSTFSAAERAAVREIWQRVSEDYAPFDVNVTTQDPGGDALTRSSSTDDTYGAEAVVTNETTISNLCGCGGIAYLSTFNMLNALAVYPPALVFPNQVGKGQVPKWLAEAVSHELGHNLGLTHQGNSTSAYSWGQGAWAPIMGASYDEPLTQWSKGEYSGANNTQDEVATMVAIGLPLVPDDVPDTFDAAFPFPTSGSFDGMISSAIDADTFTFQSEGGQVNISLASAPVGPNLDVRLELYRADGVLVSTSDPAPDVPARNEFSTSGFSASVSMPILPAGKYFARVTGTGWGDPLVDGYSAYGSIGRYQMTVVTAPPSDLVAVHTALAAGVPGLPYSQSLRSAGGAAPYSWQTISGSLPPGLTLGSNGKISGTPSTPDDLAATYTFIARVRDSSDAWSDVAETIDIAPSFEIGAAIPSTLKTGSFQAYGLYPIGATGTVTYDSNPSGNLPPGVIYKPGQILASPWLTGKYTFTIRASDGVGKQAALQVTVSVVAGPMSISSSKATSHAKSKNLYLSYISIGGTGRGTSWRKTSGTLPPGTKFSTVKSQGVLRGAPQKRGVYHFTVEVRDSAGHSASKAVTLKVV